MGPPPWFLAAALAIPMAGLAFLLGIPSLDVHWEHHPSHFWLVFGVAFLNVALGLIVSEVARRSGDERSPRGLPEVGSLGRTGAEVTVLFADLSGFTTFAEGRSATEVIDMLNAYWGAVVPFVVDQEGGFIERFAGDAILAVFNVLGDQPDHAARAVRAAIAIRDRSADARASDDWPRFRVGVNTGVVVVGNVGAGQQRSFSVIATPPTSPPVCRAWPLPDTSRSAAGRLTR